MRAIINGDDFGDSDSVNQAIRISHQQGLLTSASMMVNGGAFTQAVEISRQMPSLAVGLHLVVIYGKAALPPKEIPHLVDHCGYFRKDPLQAGLIYFFSPTARQELEREVRAQFERFAATRIPLDHVNGHLHLHLHPTVFSMVRAYAREFGAKGLRIPRDDLRLSLRYDSTGAMGKTGIALAFNLLDRWCQSQVKTDGFMLADRVYGLFQSGNMQEAYFLKVLEGLQAPLNEIYFHPAWLGREQALGPNREDYLALLSSQAKALLALRQVQLSSYTEAFNRRG